LNKISETKLLENVIGFGIYDKSIVDIIRNLNEPNPYLRGILCEIGFEKAIIKYTQPKRKHGKSKHSFYSLFDLAMIGIVSNSRVPLRIATMFGFFMGFVSFLIALVYLIYKLLNWDSFDLGVAPLIIGVFGFLGVQLFFTGIIGEYIGVLLTRVTNRPHVFESRRINFDEDAAEQKEKEQ
jgi:glycosyltransferase involved in cell wall biosynthesis